MSSTPHRFAACLALLFALASSRAASPADPLAAPRAEFRLAYDRIGTASAPATRDSPALRGYVLFPYLEAARLSQAVGEAGTNIPDSLDSRIAAFLRTNDGQPVSDGLRRSWLTSLALRSKWDQFLAFHRDSIDGIAMSCHSFTARIELQRMEGLAPQVMQAWLTPRSVPECERAFAWLRSTGTLGDELVEQRVRLALEGGNADFARQIAKPLPVERARPWLQWAALLENPRREIDALIAAPGTPVDTRALLAGWAQLARADHGAASQRFDKLVQARKLDQRAASPFALALALPLSWDRDANAPMYFARVDAADFDDYAREWQTRAALWNSDWKQASTSIAAMSEDSRRTARWRYWAARTAEKAGEDSSAKQIYESILAEDNYYSAMAAARLGRRITPTQQTLAADAAQLTRLGNLQPFVRARELRLSGLVTLAQAEWKAGQDSLQPPARSQAIHLAARWGWHDQAVAVATGERVFNDYTLLYPRPYNTEVAAASRLSGLRPDLIYGVIRQESLYRSDAVSSANAHGLMQMLLDTARRTARQWKQPVPTAVRLFEPAVNVTLGAAHLKDLLDRFDGQLPFALASYNAGPGAVQRWLPSGAMDPDVWIENIPYNETRTYVQRIPWHTVVFGWLRESQPQDTSEWLKPLRP
jgi:soluble lytic murein transglycosylase